MKKTTESYVVIYFDAEKKQRQVINPTPKFEGDWFGLAHTVTKGNYFSFNVK